jgi:hypothetical protein
MAVVVMACDVSTIYLGFEACEAKKTVMHLQKTSLPDSSMRMSLSLLNPPTAE